LRMATELGVWRIQPFEAARSVVRGERVARWERIVEAAAAQCGRADLPEVRAACSLAEALRALPPDGERRVLVPGAAGLPPPAPPCVLLVGPEGGLDPREVEAALAEGFQAEGIGSTVLRVDTAVAAALARVR
jgi:16S rRNA (uracil1498-N3)-methyltransferase